MVKVNYKVSRNTGKIQSGVAIGPSECAVMLTLKSSLNLKSEEMVMFGEFEEVNAIFKVSKSGSEIDTVIFEEVDEND